MSTTLTPVSTRPRSRFWRILRYAFAIVILALLCLGLWVYSITRSAVPQLDGTLTVSGLKAPVKVIRDAHGVPTIEAANLDDLFFAQGFVIAQDRLFQMDAMRRFAGGQLSEILGPDYVKHDREQRILGMRAAARKTVDTTAPELRPHFEAYARGVNAYIESTRDHLPIEFRILRYSPQPWTPEDTFLIAAQMVKDLNHGQAGDALNREKILAKLGPELTADLYVNSSWRDRPPTVARPSLDQNKGTEGDDEEDDEDESPVAHGQRIPLLATLAASSQAEDKFVLGSNDWVVSGAHTVTGKPLLCDDMHLGHQMPNLWYEVHLRSGNFDVAGVSLPGMPYVVVGHNQRIAWGFTNVGPTVEDVYVETFNDRGQYQTPDGWKDPEIRHEVIRVKGQPDVNLGVKITRHGPIATELAPGETRPLALRWTLYDGLRMPFFDVDSAQNWDEFRHAFSQLDAPGQNVVYADVDGNIGYQATGKIPIRASGDGSLPENGSDNAYEWTSYIPFEKLPSVFNPPGGVIGTANGRITPDGYPYSISVEWEAPWRTARIYRVLESGKKFSAADMLGLQTDVYSELDRFIAERFVYSVDHAKNATARAKQAAEILRSWDGRMIAKSPAPTIATRARRELLRTLLEPKLGPAPKDREQARATLNWKTYNWESYTVFLENVLQNQPKRWLPDNYANYHDLLAATLDAAIAPPDGPQDLSTWKWGDYNAVAINHPILGEVPLLKNWTGPGVRPQAGSGYTVKAVSAAHGPSERMTVDLSDLDHSTLNIVTGEAGNFLSPHYMDQWKAWYGGTTFIWPFTKEAVEQAGKHNLTLSPKL